MASPPHAATSPPSKRELASWWKRFRRKEAEDQIRPPIRIFGVPLSVSIPYANVAISLTNDHGESYVYGYVPIVIAKCGVFLKEKATDVEGIFRLSGSSKRIKELEVIFDSPDRYGKGLDWTGYTVHDAANILRRYLNMLPEPIVPHRHYEGFREPLKSHQAQAVGDVEVHAQDAGDFDVEKAIATYKKLIIELPSLNRQLLLYILDLLAVFASKSEQNRMPSPNLSAIFQPGILSHPIHDMTPQEYRLSQDVIIFLIENQDSFLVGMSGTGVDENTIREVQSAAQRQPVTPKRTSQVGLGRSASNASAGADSLRKQGGLRRNMSVSSKNSRASSIAPNSGSPAPSSPLASGTPTSGVQRSNTVPSQRSPSMPSGRFRNPESSTPPSSNLVPGGPLAPTARSSSPGSRLAQSNTANEPLQAASSTNPAEAPTTLNPVLENKEPEVPKPSEDKEPLSTEKLSLRTLDHGVTTTITSGNSATPSRDRKSLFSKSPSSDNERNKEARQPNKLRKKRMPDISPNASAQSSSNSLPAAPDSPAAFYTPIPTPGGSAGFSNDPVVNAPPTFSNTDATPLSEDTPRLGEVDKLSSFRVSQPGSTAGGSPVAKATKSPAGSVRSKTSVTEESEIEHADDRLDEEKPKKRRWRLSSATAKPSNDKRSGTPMGSRLGSNSVAEKSTTSVLSEGKPRKSMTKESHQTQTSTEASTSSALPSSSNKSTPSKEKEKEKEQSREKDSGQEDKEKKGPMSWIKGKVAKAKEDKKEREAEKERARSPPRADDGHATSRQSLSAVAHEGSQSQGKSIDVIQGAGEDKAAEPAAAKSKE
ncbi:GTPase activating protein (GAP) for Rho1p [Lecanora helva]